MYMKNICTYDWLENECINSHVMQVQIFKMSVNYKWCANTNLIAWFLFQFGVISN